MNVNKKTLLPFAFLVLMSCACNNHRSQGTYFLSIQNNSDNEIILSGLLTSISDTVTIAYDTIMCLKADSWEYEDLVRYASVKPHSIRVMEMDMIVDEMQDSNVLYNSIGVFHLMDIDTMSCEEFMRQYPIKKSWNLTLEDMVGNTWTLVYP